MKRITKLIRELREEMSDYEICAGLDNGDIESAEWLSISMDNDHMKIWDNETGADDQMGFIRIDYH